MTIDVLKKEWWILVGKEQVGPLSYLSLEKDNRFTPDSFVWKEGMEDWQRARYVKELENIFKDPPIDNEEEGEESETPPEDEELIIDTKRVAPPFWILWLILAIIITYVWTQLR